MKGRAPHSVAALLAKADGRRLRPARDVHSPKHHPPARRHPPFLAIAALVALSLKATAAGAAGPEALDSGPATDTPQYQRFAQAFTFDVADISGTPGETIPFVISVRGGPPNSSGFIMIRGMPESLKLSSGFQAGDSWMVALKEIRTLEMVVPRGYAGSFNLEVILVVRGSDKRDSRIVAVDIAQPQATAREPSGDLRPTNAIADPPAANTSVSPRTPSISSGLEQTLLARAAQFLQKGDISAARLAYEHLATSGSALGALSLAKTYDQEVLSSMGVIGMRGDPVEAKRWYEKAAELGSEPANRRLRELAGR